MQVAEYISGSLQQDAEYPVKSIIVTGSNIFLYSDANKEICVFNITANTTIVISSVKK